MAHRLKRRSSREWAELVREWERSGTSAAAYAARRGLNPATLTWWRSELRKRAAVGAHPRGSARASRRRSGDRARPAFAEVRVVDSAGVDRARYVEIHASAGLVVRACSGVDEDLLARVLRVVQSC